MKCGKYGEIKGPLVRENGNIQARIDALATAGFISRKETAELLGMDHANGMFDAILSELGLVGIAPFTARGGKKDEDTVVRTVPSGTWQVRYYKPDVLRLAEALSKLPVAEQEKEPRSTTAPVAAPVLTYDDLPALVSLVVDAVTKRIVWPTQSAAENSNVSQ